jgi:hypothetical protein
MSKKHYIEAAKLIEAELAVNKDNPAAYHAVRGVGFAFAQFFRNDNPRFDFDRFYAAAGLR